MIENESPRRHRIAHITPPGTRSSLSIAVSRSSQVVRDPRADPRVRVVVLVEVAHGDAVAEPGDGGVRCAELQEGPSG